MKKSVLLLVLMIIGSIGLIAQEKNQNQNQDQNQEQNQEQVRIVKIDGDVLQIRDRNQNRLQNRITLKDGTIVYPDGRYQTRDRVMLRLQDGSCLDMDGILYRNEYQYRYKIQQENKGLSAEQLRLKYQNQFHVMMVDGEMYQIKNQSQNMIREQMRLGNGVVVNPDGTYQNRERKQLRLQDGEALNMDGEMYKNTYMHRKMTAQKNMMTKKVMSKKVIQKKTPVKNKKS